MSSAEHASSASRPSLAGPAINSTTSSTASSGATAATLPRYQQLVERLKTQMATGKLSAGQRLPSLRRQAAQSGLGFRMQQAQLYYDLPTIFVSLVAIGVLGLIMDRIVVRAEERLTHWQERV